MVKNRIIDIYLIFLLLSITINSNSDDNTRLNTKNIAAVFYKGLNHSLVSPADLLPPKNSSTYIEITSMECSGAPESYYESKTELEKLGEGYWLLKKYSADIKIGKDRFEFYVFDISSGSKKLESMTTWVRGKFEFVKSKNTPPNVEIYECSHAGSNVQIVFDNLGKRYYVTLRIKSGKDYWSFNKLIG